jgi:putative ABC transport system permease protein
VWTVTLADLRMRARQFAIAVVGATLVFAMALVMAGLSGGFRAETRRTVAAVGADFFVVPTGSGGPFTSPSAVPARVVQVARRTAGVTAADPLVVIPTVTVAGTRRGGVVHLIGTRPGGMGAPSPSHGRPAIGPNDAVADDASHLRLGQRFLVGGHPFRVVGMLHGYSYFAGTPSIYVSLAGAQAVAFAGRNDITALAIRGRPVHVPARAQLFTPEQARIDMLRPVANGMRSIDVVTKLLWLVAAVIIGAIVYLSALERRQDFAVLKAVGSSARWLYGGLALQAGAVAAVSGLFAMAAEPLVGRAIPMSLAVPGRDLLLLLPVAVVIGLLASLSGLRQVVRADPALAFGSR